MKTARWSAFDVEIATAIAEKLGVKATFVTVEWDGILAGIDSGRYDIAANGIDVTEQRSEKVQFQHPLRLQPHGAGRPRRQRGHQVL